MASELKKTVTEPLADWRPMCDDDILRLLADQCGRSVAGIAAHFHVTQTAIRKRLLRLEDRQRIVRQREEVRPGINKRGRPTYQYFITSRGTTSLQESSNEGQAIIPSDG